jgi:NAD(P)-dependent dehydrogenase (short-subunit alcohol dehydrogenase family)
MTAPPDDRTGTGTGALLGGRVAIVTGASRGIGEAAADAFAAAGARVVLAARDQRALDAVVERLRARGAAAIGVATVVSDSESVARLHRRAVEEFGGVDVAFNNAAGGGHLPMPLADVGIDDFDSAYRANLRGTFVCMKHQIALMLRGGGGAIVNMSSTAGLSGVRGLAAYSATKHGIVGLTRIAALDYAERRIRVNVVAPGTIFTNKLEAVPEERLDWFRARVPMGRLGTAAEVAATVVWLCSDHAAYITGATIVVDGGRLAGAG